MKPIAVALLLIAGILNADCVQADDALAKAKGCVACHTVGKKLIGPTYREVAKKYAGQKDAEAKLVETIIKGTPAPAGVGWKQAGAASLPFMPPNAAVKPNEAARLARWILSLP